MKAIPAVVTAGDRRASKAVYGESKVYLELGGWPLVAHAVVCLQDAPEVSEVWVVGDAERLEAVFARDSIRERISKPLHIVGQFRNLFENVWETYRRLLPGAGEQGRDPDPDPDSADAQLPVLFLSGDLPFSTPQEISDFVQKSIDLDCDYALGLVTEQSMEGFYPPAPGEPGVHMAYFNLEEGRFRTSNLHLAKPARITNRTYIEEMYEHRYQKQFGNIISLAWRLLRKEEGGLQILRYYALIHMSGLADRWGWTRTADRLRAWIPLRRIAETVGGLLRADLRFVVTEVGGCALDIDNEQDFDVARLRFDQWKDAQRERALKLHGALPATASQDARADR
jgi:hypothetical protein